MQIFLVTWEITDLTIPRILQYQTAYSQYVNINQGTVSTNTSPEAWIFGDFESADKKAKELTQSQRKPYSVLKVSLLGTYRCQDVFWDKGE